MKISTLLAGTAFALLGSYGLAHANAADDLWKAEVRAHANPANPYCRSKDGLQDIAYCGNFPIGTASTGATCNYFVSPTGSDSNNGTSRSTPFLTLTKLQSTLEGASSGSKNGCLMAGTFTTSGITLTTADNGESWNGDPSSAVDAAIVQGPTVTEIFEISSGSGITFNGFTIQNFANYGIHHDSATNIDNITIENMSIGTTNVTGTWSSGAVYINGVDGITISNNYIHDMESEGIALFAYDTGDVLDNVSITNNVCLRTVQAQTDGGCYYASDHNGYKSSGNTTITNNYSKDIGASGSYQGAGIYLDDSASYWTVSGNIIGPPNPAGTPASSGYTAMGIEENNGINNTVKNNIIDLGTTGNVVAVLFYYGDSPATSLVGANQSGEVVQNNIIIADFTGSNDAVQWGNYMYPEFSGTAGDYTIGPNLYYNFGGGQMLTDGPIASDSNPKTENPDFTNTSTYNYNLSGSSPIFSSPFNFTALPTSWGPPSFSVPINGAAPSY